eukprot:m.85859 g.85859  ORF g.85859 m.85859 type:complete len:1019 (+) comp13027_c0_seq3:236-3292(+)
MAETADRVVAFINKAQIGNTKDKIDNIRKVHELVIRTPELLDNFIEEILQFQLDKNADVRKEVVQFAEDACKQDVGLLPRAAETLLYLLGDTSVAVVRRTIAANTNLCKVIFAAVAKNSGVRNPQELWHTVQNMKEKIMELLKATNDGVRTSALKYLEVLVLVLSMPTAESEKKGNTADFGLNLVPLSHPFLEVGKLRDEGRQLLDVLISRIEDVSTSGAGIGVIASILSNIARKRPTFMGRIISFLCDFYNSPPDHLAKKWKSISSNLKLNLVHLLKHPSSAEFHEKLVPVLESLQVSASTISEYDRRGQMMGVSTSYDASNDGKRSLSDSSLPDAKRAKTSLDNARELYSRIKTLPIKKKIEILVKSMGALPSKLPDNLKDLPTLQIDVLSKLERKQTIHAATEAPKFGNKVKVEPRVETPPVAPPKISKQFKLEHSILSKEETQNMTKKAFERILAAESKAIGDFWRNWATTVARIVSELQNEDLTNAILDFILDKPREREELAQLWLHHEYVKKKSDTHARKNSSNPESESGTSEDSKEDNVDSDAADTRDRYEESSCKLLLGLKDTNPDPKDRLFTSFILGLPEISDGIIEKIKVYCEDKDQQRKGLTTLMELLKYRPPSREKCLKVLLSYCDHSNPLLRQYSITACKKLFTIAQLKGDIVNHSKSLMSRIISKTDQDGNKWTSDKIKLCLQLHIGLTAAYPENLAALVDVYVNIPEKSTQKTVLSSLHITMRQRGCQITQDRPEVLQVLSKSTAGAEALMINLLHALVENAPPSQELVAVARNLYKDYGDDARCMVPVLQGLPKAEIFNLLPNIFALQKNIVDRSIDLMLDAQGAAKPPLSAAELLVSIHTIDASKYKHLTLHNLLDASKLCFEKKRFYNHDVLAVVLQQLVQRSPLPDLFMRTVIESLKNCPNLKGFVINILRILASKEIWDMKTSSKQSWRGFVLACQQSLPESLNIIIHLPKEPMLEAFKASPPLKKETLNYVARIPATKKDSLPEPLLDIIKEIENAT